MVFHPDVEGGKRHYPPPYRGSRTPIAPGMQLELEVDIGGLDGVVLAGFPDTIMAAWQRIGRAGRDWRSKAFVLYYAINSALDTFHVHDLSAFLSKPLDELVVNPENETLVERHLPALLR